MARLRETGAVLLGKTTTPEFGWKGVTDSPAARRHRQPVGRRPDRRRARAAERPPQSGSAWGPGRSAPTAADRCASPPRSPAPSRSSRRTAGSRSTRRARTAPSRTAGPMTRTVTDAALLLDLIAGPDSRDWAALPSPRRPISDGLRATACVGLRVALSPTLGYGRNDPEVEAAVRAAAAACWPRRGAHVEEVDPGLRPTASTPSTSCGSPARPR